MSADISTLIEQIRAGLDKATAGQWTWGQKYVCHKDGWDYIRLFNTPDDKQAPEGSQWEADAAHVANCCPDNIRRLLDHIAELEARNVRLMKDLAFADEQAAKVEALLEPHIQWEPGTIRICPMRDGPCPHGMTCQFVGDGYSGYPCKPGWQSLPSAPKGGADHG